MPGLLRRAAFYGRIAGHISLAIAKVAVLYPRWSPERRAREVSDWSHGTLSIFGFRVVVRGEPPPAGRTHLLAANHTSWLDIYAILAITPVVFVAKEEVRAWPAIGWLAGRLGTIFVPRRRSQDMAGHVQALAKALAEGLPVGLFPEGTTTDGSTVLPFRPPFFEAAAVTRTPVQPVALRYIGADGRPATRAAFTGDMTLVESFQRLADCGEGIVEITFLPPIEAGSRRELAGLAEAAIRDHLDTARGAGAAEAQGQGVAPTLLSAA